MSTINSIKAFVLGGIVGVTVGLLYAPYSGEKTRIALRSNAQVLKEKALDSLREAESQIESLTEESKKRLGKLQEIGQQTLEEQKQSLKAGIKQAREVVAGNENGGLTDEV